MIRRDFSRLPEGERGGINERLLPFPVPKALLQNDGRTYDQIAGDEEREQREAERCRAEIAALKAALLAGHPDTEGLCRALADWSAELNMIETLEAL